MTLHARVILAVIWTLALPATLPAQDSSSGKDKPLAFRTAIELAVKNSTTTGLAQADLQRARATVTQARDVFLPQAVIGSGLGGSYGFPLSLEGAAPSIFNVNFQGALLNAAQRSNVKAARSEVDVTTAQNADRRNDVIMETALDYVQLDLLESSLSIQREQQQGAQKFQDIVAQRVQAGLDSQVDATRAKLVGARTKLDIAQTQAAADQLRMRLSQLTGLPAASIQTSTESIPELPAVAQDQDLPGEAIKNNPVVKVADAAAQAKEFRAQAERKQLYPAVDFVGQYAVLARFNNYDQFFQKFQRHNITAGVAIRFPFFNPVQRATAEAAKADAAKSRKEAQTVKEQVGTETLKLQRSVQQLAAAREVAQLEHQLAQSDIEAAHAKIESGAASVKEEESARVLEHQRYTAYLNSSFELDRAQIQLMRQIGQLEAWALGQPRR
ncbi:MAG TPA: TolC family protein [Candidatus Angelobacter sp.]|jgi:outer membrane protein TolC|nr:TolC family protein [Candidatus Angelobacter sp.]